MIVGVVANTVENNLKAAVEEFDAKIALYQQQKLDDIELLNEELVRIIGC